MLSVSIPPTITVLLETPLRLLTIQPLRRRAERLTPLMRAFIDLMDLVYRLSPVLTMRAPFGFQPLGRQPVLIDDGRALHEKAPVPMTQERRLMIGDTGFRAALIAFLVPHKLFSRPGVLGV